MAGFGYYPEGHVWEEDQESPFGNWSCLNCGMITASPLAEVSDCIDDC